MRSTLLGFLLLQAHQALSMDRAGEEIKNGVEPTNTQTYGIQSQNSGTKEGLTLESAIMVTEGDPETTDSGSTISTVSEALKPDDNNVNPISSTDFKEKNGSMDYKQTEHLEFQHLTESNSNSSTPEANDTQLIESKEQEVSSGAIYYNKTLVLIISCYSQPQSNTYNVSMNDNLVKLYVPVKGCKYVEIKDKEVTVWKASEEEYGYIVYELIRSQERKMIMIMARGEVTNKYCYKKQGGRWEKILPCVYYSKIFMPLQSEKQYIVYDLDTSANYNENSTLVECYLDDVYTRMYFDKQGTRVGTIRYGGQKLYEIPCMFETYSKAKISLLFGRPALLDIELFTLAFKRNVRFEMYKGVWKQISSIDYYENMYRYKEYYKNQQNGNSDVIALNLNEPKEEKVQMIVRSPQEQAVSTIEYVPKERRKIGYVIAEGHIIWAHPEGEDCTVMSTYKNNSPVLVMIEYKDDRPTEFLSYEDRWSEVHSQKYYDEIVELYRM